MFGGFASDYRVFSKMLRTLAQGCGSSAWVCAVHGEHNWVIGKFSGSGAARRVGRQSARRRLGELRAERRGRAGGRRSPAERPLGFRQRLRPCAVAAAQRRGEGRRQAGGAAVPRADRRRRDRRRLARHGPVRHRQQVGRRQGRHGAGDAFGQPARAQDRHRAGRRRASRQSALPHAAKPARFVLAELGVRRPGRARRRGVLRTRASGGRAVCASPISKPCSSRCPRPRPRPRRRPCWSSRPSTATSSWSSPGRRSPPSRSPGRGAIPPMRRSSRSAVKLIFEAAGGTALYAGNPLQEIFRDTMAASAHLSLTWHRAAPMYGQIRLGLPVDFDRSERRNHELARLRTLRPDPVGDLRSLGQVSGRALFQGRRRFVR